MPQQDPAFDCLFNTISDFLLPFFLTGAAGDPDAARAAIAVLIKAYNPGTTTELDLVGRVIGFGIVAMDNLRLSMGEDLSDTKVLRYRFSAVSLSRAAEKARQILQASRKTDSARDLPSPAESAEPTPKPALPTPPTVKHSLFAAPPLDIEAMKRDARFMMATFAKHGAGSGLTIPIIPDPAVVIAAAARAAVTAAAVTAAKQTPAAKSSAAKQPPAPFTAAKQPPAIMTPVQHTPAA